MPMPISMHTAASTSFDLQQRFAENESPASIVLCSTSTQQRGGGGSMNNFQAMPNVSSSNLPYGSAHLSNDQDSCIETIIPEANVATVYNQLPFDAVQFGLFVAQRLSKLPDERSRRKLENSIQAVILDVERESFQ